MNIIKPRHECKGRTHKPPLQKTKKKYVHLLDINLNIPPLVMTKLHDMLQSENEKDIKSTQITFKTGACHGYQTQRLSFINGVTQNHHYKSKQTTTL